MSSAARVDAKRSIIVTGAGNGLGAEIAMNAGASGWKVGVLDANGVAAASCASTIGSDAIALVADTTDESAIEYSLAQFADFTNRAAPDALVCNAGIVRFGPLLDVSIADWRAVVDVNLTGTFTTARAVARRMVAADIPGAIVAITSMNGVAPGPNSGAYGATKAGIARLIQQMALEWGQFGIRVNAVAPGLIDAGMSEPIYADPDIRARRSQRVPLGRLGTAADVSGTVMFLLSDEAAYITGTEVLVDGGVTMSVMSTLPRPQAVDSVGLVEPGDH